MVNSPRGGGARTTEVRVSAGAGCRRSAHWALRGVTAGVLRDRPPGPDPRYYTALWKHVPEDHGGPGTPDPPMNELHAVHRREFTKRGG